MDKPVYLPLSKILEIERSGRAVHIRPRRYEVVIDGYKVYRISVSVLERYKYFKKTGYEV